MKFWATVIKSLKENLRDWKVLVLVLAFSPFFLFLMYLFYGGGSTVYNIGILNHDNGKLGVELIDKFHEYKGTEDLSTFRIIQVSNIEELVLKAKAKEIDIGIKIPADYSEKLKKRGNLKSEIEPPKLRFYGSTGNFRYVLAAIVSSDIINKHALKATNITLPYGIEETFLEKKQVKNEFEGYVPGLISMAVLMILFTATASIVKENDKNTILRLKLSRLGAFDFLTGISIVQAIIAILAMLLAYLSALLLGYRPAGGFGAVLIVGILSSFSMVALSLIVASYLNTIFDVLTVGCFPFFILMFFSGCMFPVPKVNIFSIGGYMFGLADILPLTHTVSAFNKILNFGAGVQEVGFELFMIGLLTVIYFGVGMLLYQKRKLSKA